MNLRRRVESVIRAALGQFDEASDLVKQQETIIETLQQRYEEKVAAFDTLRDETARQMAEMEKSVAERIAATNRTAQAHYRAALRHQGLTQYFTELWQVQGKEYGAAQNVMTQIIDDLRQKLGIYNGPYMSEEQKKAFASRFEPPHPAAAVRGHEDKVIPDTPVTVEQTVAEELARSQPPSHA